MSRRLHGEAGASLILAMAFLALFGAASVSLLGLTGTSHKNTVITRARATQLYAADGGIETGIRRLQTDPGVCDATGTPWEPATISPVTINGKTVTITCKTMAGGATTTTTGGGSPLLNGKVAILGSGGLTINSKPNATTPFLFRGGLYSGGPIATDSLPLTVQGDIGYYVACPPLPSDVTLTGSGVCSHPPSAPVVAVPTVVVPPGPTPLAPASVPFGSKCTILYPGRYTSANAPGFIPSRDYYLASGTYYFENTGEITLKGSIFGGAPGLDTKQILSTSPCATDADAARAAPSYDATRVGSGVTILLGGSAVLAAANNSEVEFYSRVPNTAVGSTDFGATPGVAIWARATAQANYVAVRSGATAFTTQDSTATMVLHGLTYLPDSIGDIVQPVNPDTDAAAPAALFMGGLVAKALFIGINGAGKTDVAAPIGGVVFKSTTTNSTRTTLVCANAASTTGASPTLIEAAVRLDPTTTPVIQSWRRVTAC